MQSNGHAIQVLLVEDDRASARWLVESLRDVGDPGFQVRHAESLREAIAALSEGEYDIALLDLSLPDAFGIETVRDFCAAAGDLPVVVLTSLDDHGIAMRALHEGAQDYLVKGETPGPLLVRSMRYAIERKRADAERTRLYSQLVETDKRKTEFLAMLGHELRNPLAPILSALEVIRLSGDQDTTRRWAVEMVERQARNMARLIDDLLDVSRITRGKVQLRTETVDLGALIERAVATIRPYIDDRGHRLVIDRPKEPISLNADTVRLEQVLVNLLGNAAKFSSPFEPITLTVQREGDEAVLRIKDLGSGIDAKLLPRIFDLFVQEESSLDRARGGLGIGLTLVRSLVEMHGGSVQAFSEGKGKGSEFVVRLPTSRSTSAQESKNPAEHAEVRPGLRVLLVDDNVDSANGLAKVLKIWGCAVHAAHDGFEALRLAPTITPQVILLDIGLPGLDGYAVAKAIRQEASLTSTMLVALTGYGQEEDQRRAKDAGFDLHMTKPVNLKVLKELLASCGDDRESSAARG